MNSQFTPRQQATAIRQALKNNCWYVYVRTPLHDQLIDNHGWRIIDVKVQKDMLLGRRLGVEGCNQWVPIDEWWQG